MASTFVVPELILYVVRLVGVDYAPGFGLRSD